MSEKQDTTKRMPVNLPIPTHELLTSTKKKMGETMGRIPSFPEVIEILIENWKENEKC